MLLDRLERRSRGCLEEVCSELRRRVAAVDRAATASASEIWEEAAQLAVEADQRLRVGLPSGTREASDGVMAAAERAEEALREAVRLSFQNAKEDCRRAIVDAREQLRSARLKRDVKPNHGS
jgi:hypothetical protein